MPLFNIYIYNIIQICVPSINGFIFTKKRYASQVNMMFGLISKKGEETKNSILNTRLLI